MCLFSPTSHTVHTAHTPFAQVELGALQEDVAKAQQEVEKELMMLRGQLGLVEETIDAMMDRDRAIPRTLMEMGSAFEAKLAEHKKDCARQNAGMTKWVKDLVKKEWDELVNTTANNYMAPLCIKKQRAKADAKLQELEERVKNLEKLMYEIGKSMVTVDEVAGALKVDEKGDVSVTRKP